MPVMGELDILLVGPYPPPYGGISTHVQRLAQAIQRAGLTVGVLNHFQGQGTDPLVIGELGRHPWRYWRSLRRARARVVHYHHSRWSTLLATAFALRNSRASRLATIHGQELEPFLRGRIPGVAQVTRRALRTFDVLIAVSVEIEPSLRTVGRPVQVTPAYLPPGDEPAQLSPQAAAFLRRGTNLVVAAYRLSVDDRGRTIYGLETAVRAFASAARVRPDLQLAIFLASQPDSHRDRELLRNVIAVIDDEHIRTRIGVFSEEPLTAAFEFTSVFLRPTLTDGDSVSIREAMAAGVPVVASDVVRRPSGVVTLGPGEAQWCAAILQALERAEPTFPAVNGVDPASELMGIYALLGCTAPSPLERVIA
jgi:glycogen synthase